MLVTHVPLDQSPFSLIVGTEHWLLTIVSLMSLTQCSLTMVRDTTMGGVWNMHVFMFQGPKTIIFIFIFYNLLILNFFDKFC